jgi:hypothetical protein
MKSIQYTEIIKLNSLSCYSLFANKITKEKQYEAQRKNTMVDGKTTTNFISPALKIVA